VKGVGVGRGVSAVTIPSGVWSTPSLRMELRVDVRNGMRVDGGELRSLPCAAQAVRNKREEKRRIERA
jgi:hypothetical protein